jgi:hypothetical protein
MDAEALRSTQAPLKARYREVPEAAFITLRAKGRLGQGVSCRIETGKALVSAGLHPATGGSGQGACSGDMLLEALVACAGVTLNAVATSLGIALRDAFIKHWHIRPRSSSRAPMPAAEAVGEIETP